MRLKHYLRITFNKFINQLLIHPTSNELQYLKEELKEEYNSIVATVYHSSKTHEHTELKWHVVVYVTQSTAHCMHVILL